MEVRVGIYARLSNDDLHEGESMSIENQKLLLTDYCFRNGWKIVDYYADDGYSGLSFHRPEVQRLIADAKIGKINLILVKDLSRFGRNYTECGYYEEELFPSIGCRFIALNDGIDSAVDNNDMMPFQNLYNEMYSQDMSKRIKSAKRTRAKAGHFIAAYEPYGYSKCEYQLVIDAPAAEVVRRIFRMRAEGETACRIAAVLNEDGVLPPRDYYYQRIGKPNPRNTCHRWTDGGVRQILRNEAYIGNLVQMKTHYASCKNRKLIPEPPENMVRCENTHTPIIDRETWDMVQAMWKPQAVQKKKYVPLFGGLLRCADCGASMNFKPDSNYRKDGTNIGHHAYTCGTYKHGGAAACTSSHWILENALMEIVQNDLEQYTEELRTDADRLEHILLTEYSKAVGCDRAALIAEQQRSAARIEEIDTMLGRLYEELLAGQLERAALAGLSERLKEEKAVLVLTAKQAQAGLDAIDRKAEDIRAWVEIVQEYMSGTALDRELMQRLVREIRVGDVTAKDVPREIVIVYRF